MSGGIAYVFDEYGDFAEKRCNLESVDLEPLIETQDVHLAGAKLADAALVKDLVAQHLSLTRSPRAAWILDNWTEALTRFIKVFPHEHKRVLGVSRRRKPYITTPPVDALMPAEQVQHG
jgi:glutamate synthase domain-containing protein 3